MYNPNWRSRMKRERTDWSRVTFTAPKVHFQLLRATRSRSVARSATAAVLALSTACYSEHIEKNFTTRKVDCKERLPNPTLQKSFYIENIKIFYKSKIFGWPSAFAIYQRLIDSATWRTNFIKITKKLQTVPDNNKGWNRGVIHLKSGNSAL